MNQREDMVGQHPPAIQDDAQPPLQHEQPPSQGGSTGGVPISAPAPAQPAPAAPQAPHLEREWERFPEYPEYADGHQRTPWPPGFVGKVAQYLYCHSPSPVPEYAIAAAVGFFAGICGRGWIYCVFRPIVTGRSGIVTADSGIVTDRFGIVTEGVLEGFEGCV